MAVQLAFHKHSQWVSIVLADYTTGKFRPFCLTRCAGSTMKTEAQLLPPSAVKVEEIDPLEGQEELGIFQMLDKLEEVTETLLTRWIIVLKKYCFQIQVCSTPAVNWRMRNWILVLLSTPPHLEHFCAGKSIWDFTVKRPRLLDWSANYSWKLKLFSH